jgi:hypothetical protein
MRLPVKITTGFPSAAKAARDLGVSKKVAKNLAELARRSMETGEYVLPGFGRLEPAGHGKRGARVVRFKTAKKADSAVKRAAKK